VPTTTEKKPTPEQLLQQLETEEACSTKDVAATAMQPPSVSPGVKAIVSMLEAIPLKTSRTT